MRRRLAGLAPLLLVVGCKGMLLDDLAAPPRGPRPGEVIADRELLGVVVDPTDPPGPGVRVVRLLRQGPAEAAGLRPGDRLVGLARDVPPELTAGEGEATVPAGERPIAGVEDLEAALEELAPGVEWFTSADASALGSPPPVPELPRLRWSEPDDPPPSDPPPLRVTVLRGGLRLSAEVAPVTRGAYAALARRRLAEIMAADPARVVLPLLFDYLRLEVPPAAWEAYRGRRPREPVLVYRDVDVLPLLGVFSAFRHEVAPLRGGAWRVQVLLWPFVFGGGDPEAAPALQSLFPPEEARLRVY